MQRSDQDSNIDDEDVYDPDCDCYRRRGYSSTEICWCGTMKEHWRIPGIEVSFISRFVSRL
jgi:hypothetical protein